MSVGGRKAVTTTTREEEGRLEPCPFPACGSVEITVEEVAPRVWSAWCLDCRAGGPHCDSEEAATEWWNRGRSPSPGLIQKGREMERAEVVAFIDGPYEYRGQWSTWVVTRRDNVKSSAWVYDAETLADDVCVEITAALERGDHLSTTTKGEESGNG